MKAIFQLIILVHSLLSLSCNVKDRIRKHELAQEKADNIIERLDKPEIEEQFPLKYFPREQLSPLLREIRINCDWPNRRGKFVDFFTIQDNTNFHTAYIYEYFMSCDSLRFILIYNFNTENPELINFRVEPIEQPNGMIIDPKKSLLFNE